MLQIQCLRTSEEGENPLFEETLVSVAGNFARKKRLHLFVFCSLKFAGMSQYALPPLPLLKASISYSTHCSKMTAHAG